MAAIPLSESAATAGHKISTFLQSLLLLFLDTIHRAFGTFSSDNRTSPTHPTTTGPENEGDASKMATPNPATKPSVIKIVPALPLLPPRAPKQENEPPKAPEPKLDPVPVQQKPETPVVESMARLQLGISAPPQHDLTKASIPVYGVTGESAVHAAFMREALEMAQLALRTNETPVGCVFVSRGRVVAKGMNATNITRNGTRHAELMGISALLSYSPGAETRPKTRSGTSDPWDDVDPKDGYLYPYGQKLHPSPRVGRSIFSDCILYVTVEPCIMCASLLRQLGIKKVYFGAVNDKFGGTGGVFRIHTNSPPAKALASGLSPLSGKHEQTVNGTVLKNQSDTATCNGVSGDNALLGGDQDAGGNVADVTHESLTPQGDGGNVEPGYEAEGGWGRDEAVTLLRQFYVQENNRAPVPRKKEGRAARLHAMMERDGHAGGPMIKAEATSATPEPTSSVETAEE